MMCNKISHLLTEETHGFQLVPNATFYSTLLNYAVNILINCNIKAHWLIPFACLHILCGEGGSAKALKVIHAVINFKTQWCISDLIFRGEKHVLVLLSCCYVLHFLGHNFALAEIQAYYRVSHNREADVKPSGSATGGTLRVSLLLEKEKEGSTRGYCQSCNTGIQIKCNIWLITKQFVVQVQDYFSTAIMSGFYYFYTPFNYKTRTFVRTLLN